MRRATASRFETARLRTDGSLVLSRRTVRKASWQPRQEVVVLPIGDALFLVPRQSVVLEASQAISKVLAEDGVTQDQLLAGLVEERRRYNREHYTLNTHHFIDDARPRQLSGLTIEAPAMYLTRYRQQAIGETG